MERNARRGREDARDDRGDRGGRDDRSARGSRDERPSRDRDDGGSRRGRDSDDRGSRGGRGSGYSYQPRDADATRRRGEQGAKDFDKYLDDSVKMFKPNDGDNIIRFLPPTWEKPEHWGYDIHVHFGIGPDRQAYLCLHKMKGEACPICEERAQAIKDGDDAYAKELEPKRRVLVYLVDRDHEKEGIQAWSMPWTLDRDIIKVTSDKRSGEVLNVDDPDQGYDVEFEKKGAKDRTEYLGVAIARRSSGLDNDKAMDFAVDNPLPSILKFYSYEHISTQFSGSSGAGRDRDSDSRDSRDSRGGRDSRDDRSSDRGRDSDRDDPRSARGGDRGGRDADDDVLTWAQIHEMNYDELCDLVDAQRLDIDPDKSKSDEDLADWICEEMKIEEKPKEQERESSSRGRLADMRRGRGD